MDHFKLMRAHPISILTWLHRFLFLLIVPLVRGFLSALHGGLVVWLRGAWVDLIVVTLILALAYQKWVHFGYNIDINRIIYTQGIFFQRQTIIPLHRICTFTVLHPFWLRPLKIAQIRIETMALDPKKPDLVFFVSESQAQAAANLFRQPALKHSGRICEYRPHLHSVIFLSLFTSNWFFGILLLSTFISQTGQILGTELSILLLDGFESLSRQLSDILPALASNLTAGRIVFSLPPIAASIALLLFIGWLAAFLLNLMQTKNLAVRRSKDALHIEAGIFVHKEYCVRTADVNYVDIRQSLLTRTLRLYSVFIDAVGIGKDKSDIAAIVPFSRRPTALHTLHLLLPEFQHSTRTLKPNGGAVMKFLLDPLWPCLLIPLGTMAAVWLLPSWAAILKFAGLMLALPAYWFLGVRLMDFFSSGLSKHKNCFTLCYSNFYYLHTVIIPSEKIALVNIRQSILQRGDDKCDVVLYSRSEGSRRHHLRNLQRQPVIKLFDAVDSWTPADAGLPNWYERLFSNFLSWYHNHFPSKTTKKAN